MLEEGINNKKFSKGLVPLEMHYDIKAHKFIVNCEPRGYGKKDKDNMSD